MYVTVAELAQHLDLPPEQDAPTTAQLQRAATAASDSIDAYCGRTFTAVTPSQSKIYRARSAQTQMIDDATTVTAVETSSDRSTWTTLAAGDWWTEPDNATVITRVATASQLDEWIRVTGTFGWATVPAAVVESTLIKAARLWKRKDSPTGIGEGLEGFAPTFVSRYEDGDVQILLASLRRADKVFGFA